AARPKGGPAGRNAAGTAPEDIQVPGRKTISIPSPQGRPPQAEGTGAAIRQQPPGEKGQRLLPQKEGGLTARAAAARCRGSHLIKFPSPRVGAERGVLIGY